VALSDLKKYPIKMHWMYWRSDQRSTNGKFYYMYRYVYLYSIKKVIRL